MASKAIEFSEKRKIRVLRRSRSLKVIEGGTSRKSVCDFLLVINSNWHPISYRCGVIAAYCSNFRHFAFLSHPSGLRDNVRCSSWAHRKARSGLPISVNWTFFARCYGWGATSDYLFKIGDFAPTGACRPKISGSKGRPPPTILFLRKLG